MNSSTYYNACSKGRIEIVLVPSVSALCFYVYDFHILLCLVMMNPGKGNVFCNCFLVFITVSLL